MYLCYFVKNVYLQIAILLTGNIDKLWVNNSAMSKQISLFQCYTDGFFHFFSELRKISYESPSNLLLITSLFHYSTNLFVLKILIVVVNYLFLTADANFLLKQFQFFL